MNLHGQNFLGRTTSALGSTRIRAVNPAGSHALEPEFVEATRNEIDSALHLAQRAYKEYRRLAPTIRAAFLRRIADEIESLGDALIERANQESGLPAPRLEGERARTTNQLRLFAGLVEEGSWVDARIDRAQPNRKPLPKPDVRRMLIPIGPVAVFGASNFPLAFSVAGGDTASALAAGCSVVVKAHPAHPGTSELVGEAILAAANETGVPDGVFSLVHGASHDVGLALVRHPITRAVAFTGSLRGGRALFDAAARREDPIPVFAEMGSINPVVVLPEAGEERSEDIAQGLYQSVTLGVGQFCTNPGLVVACEGRATNRMVAALKGLITEHASSPMLSAGICRAFRSGVESVTQIPGVEVIAQGKEVQTDDSTGVSPVLLKTDAATFRARPELREELFGPATLVVTVSSDQELLEVIQRLEGQLTATIHASDTELASHEEVVQTLTDVAGRLVFNGFPTGVEVCPSMHHGGPYPATTDVRTTSVGTAAIYRFARPVCYQDFPQQNLPVELRDPNERGVWRLVDGELTR